MNYKTVLVHVDQSRPSATRLRVAAQLAKQHTAHLVGAAMTGISRFIFESGGFNPDDPVFAHQLEHLHQYARKGLAQFDRIANESGVDSIEARLVDDDAAGGMALHARYADLAVLGQFDPSESLPGLMSNFPEYVMLNSACPVLVLPFAGEFNGKFSRPMLAWDGSQQASRAVAGALPILRQAALVDVVVFNPESGSDAHGEQPGTDLALYLARHGIKVNVIQRRINIDVGNALLSLTTDLGSDLIVMGAYGHARFREVVLGGATRTILTSMTLPVLMAH